MYKHEVTEDFLSLCTEFLPSFTWKAKESDEGIIVIPEGFPLGFSIIFRHDLLEQEEYSQLNDCFMFGCIFDFTKTHPKAVKKIKKNQSIGLMSL